MGRHTTSASVSCPRCGASTERLYVADSRPSGIRFTASIRCPACGLTEEADGPALTDDARNAFYATEGRWSARVVDMGSRQADALRSLRRLRSEAPAELLRLVREGGAVVEGALVEVEYVEDQLRSVGVQLVRSRLGGTDRA